MKQFLLQRHFIIGLVLVLPLLGIGCSGSSGGDGGVFRSNDAGLSWEQKTFVGQQGRRVQTISTVNVQTIEVNPSNPDIMYLGTESKGLYVSLNAGEQWLASKITTGTVYAIAFDPTNSDIVYMANGNKLLKATDGGVEWTSVYVDVNATAVTSVVIDTNQPNTLYLSTMGGNVMKSVDGGAHWDVRLQQDDGIKKLYMVKDNPTVLYAFSVEGDILKSDTGGEPIRESAGKINTGWGDLFPEDFTDTFNKATSVNSFVLDPNDNSVCYVATPRGLLRGSNGCKDWEDIATLLGFNNDQNKDIRNLRVTPGDSNTLYFSVGKAIQKSTDRGSTWQNISTFPSARSISTLLIHPTSPEIVYAGTKAIKEKKGFIKSN